MTHRTLYRLANICRLSAKTLHLWPTWVVIAYFSFTTVPHVRVNFDRHSACTYLGSRGLVSAPQFYRCHWLVILDSAKQRRL